jgi:hypothetical protein
VAQVPNAESYSVSFSDTTRTERNYDWVTLYGDDNNTVYGEAKVGPGSDRGGGMPGVPSGHDTFSWCSAAVVWRFALGIHQFRLLQFASDSPPLRRQKDWSILTPSSLCPRPGWQYTGGMNGSERNFPGTDARPPLVINAPRFRVYFKSDGSNQVGRKTTS